MFNKNHPKAIRTHHANRYKKNGITINSICTDNEAGKDKVVSAINDSSELELVKVVPPVKQAEAKSLFEQIDGQVIRFISEKYGEIAGKANQKSLYVNCHIYYTDPDFVLYRGGMGSYYNWTGRTVRT